MNDSSGGDSEPSVCEDFAGMKTKRMHKKKTKLNAANDICFDDSDEEAYKNANDNNKTMRDNNFSEKEITQKKTSNKSKNGRSVVIMSDDSDLNNESYVRENFTGEIAKRKCKKEANLNTSKCTPSDTSNGMEWNDVEEEKKKTRDNDESGNEEDIAQINVNGLKGGGGNSIKLDESDDDNDETSVHKDFAEKGLEHKQKKRDKFSTVEDSRHNNDSGYIEKVNDNESCDSVPGKESAYTPQKKSKNTNRFNDELSEITDGREMKERKEKEKLSSKRKVIVDSDED